MRWNCPHCSETVSLGIDIEQVKRAYVRCGACKGVALIQTRASYADHQAMKPQTETVLRTDPNGNVTIGINDTAERSPSPRPARAAAPVVSSLASHMVGSSQPAHAPAPASALPANMPPLPGPMNSLGANVARDAAGNFDVTPPPFNPRNLKAPAFLLRENPIPMPIQFSTKDDPVAPAPVGNEKLLRLAVALATAAAVLSGLYLFYQGQKLM